MVYDDLSGNTLKLDVVMTEVFKRLHEGPATRTELANHLAEVLDLESNRRLEHVTKRALGRLEESGLVIATPQRDTTSTPFQ